MATVAKTKLTPPEVARLWGIGPDKVVHWIKAGELAAIDASTNRGQRPRYLIDINDLRDFESRRSATSRPPWCTCTQPRPAWSANGARDR